MDIEADDGTVPLHFAVWMNNFAMVKWLVEVARCDLHKLNAFGCNASQWGALNGDVNMLKLLQAYGLDLGLLNHNGHSAIHKAAVNGRLAACQWLLGRLEERSLSLSRHCHGDNNATSSDEALRGNVDSARSKDFGGGLSYSVHMRADRSGNTPAMIALNNGHLDTSAWLDSYTRDHLLSEGDHGNCLHSSENHVCEVYTNICGENSLNLDKEMFIDDRDELS